MLKTVITVIVSDKRGLGLPVPSQFLIYSVYFLVLFVAYFFAAVLAGLRHFRQGRHQPLALAQELRSPAHEKAGQALSAQAGAPGDGARASRERCQLPETRA